MAKGTTFSIRGPLVKKFEKKESFKVLLSWTTPILSLRLSSTFDADENFQCQVRMNEILQNIYISLLAKKVGFY